MSLAQRLLIIPQCPWNCSRGVLGKVPSARLEGYLPLTMLGQQGPLKWDVGKLLLPIDDKLEHKET